jgi:hypothetical protein
MIRRLTILVLLFALAVNVGAQDYDQSVKRQLDLMELDYEIDEHGDFKFLWPVGDNRTQLVWINSTTNSYLGQEIREVWSPANVYSGPLPADVANMMLLDSYEKIMGGWYVYQEQEGGRRICAFCTKILANADRETLRAALMITAQAADEMEYITTDGADAY